MQRCDWTGNDALMMHYHDTEWGVPVHDDQLLFEYLVLDAFQAGLSWKTVLHKRENFRQAFDGFDATKIACYDDAKIAALLADKGIIRNRLKIFATIGNAKSFLRLQKEYGSFDHYIWQFTDYQTIVNNFTSIHELPARTEISDRMSKALLREGFKFVGSTICYAFMQAAGMVNDHLSSCFRYNEVLIQA